MVSLFRNLCDDFSNINHCVAVICLHDQGTWSLVWYKDRDKIYVNGMTKSSRKKAVGLADIVAHKLRTSITFPLNRSDRSTLLFQCANQKSVTVRLSSSLREAMKMRAEAAR